MDETTNLVLRNHWPLSVHTLKGKVTLRQISDMETFQPEQFSPWQNSLQWKRCFHKRKRQAAFKHWAVTYYTHNSGWHLEFCESAVSAALHSSENHYRRLGYKTQTQVKLEGDQSCCFIYTAWHVFVFSSHKDVLQIPDVWKLCLYLGLYYISHHGTWLLIGCGWDLWLWQCLHY